MSEPTRRKLLRNISLGLGTATRAGPASLLTNARSLAAIESEGGNSLINSIPTRHRAGLAYPRGWRARGKQCGFVAR